MHRDIVRLQSRHLGFDTPVARYGHAGRPLLLFPTWASDYLESERQGLIAAIADLVEAGRVQVFCIDSISPLAWCDAALPVPEKVRRQALHSAYVEDEVVEPAHRQQPDLRGSLGATPGRHRSGEDPERAQHRAG